MGLQRQEWAHGLDLPTHSHRLFSGVPYHHLMGGTYGAARLSRDMQEELREPTGGDRVAVYMPPCPEALVLMLAVTRIGAIHLVVFAGFGSVALAERIQLSGARWLFAADATWRKGKDVPLMGIVQRSVDSLGELLERMVVLKRTPGDVPLRPGRDLLWDDFLKLAKGQDNGYEIMESNEPAFILAHIRDHRQTQDGGPHPRAVSGPHRQHGPLGFGMRPEEIWWATSDIGWIVGHSYILYAPLLMGCTTSTYEGGLDHRA